CILDLRFTIYDLRVDSFSKAVDAPGPSDTGQTAAEYDVRNGDECGAEQPAPEYRAGHGPGGGEMPDGGDDQIEQRHGEHEFPGKIKKLIHGEARERAANPDEQQHEPNEFAKKPNIRRAAFEEGQGRAQTAEKERGAEPADDKHAEVFAEEEERV